MLAKYIREAHADYRRIRRRVPLGPFRTEAEYHRAVAMLNEIIDEIDEQETHPPADLIETSAKSLGSPLDWGLARGVLADADPRASPVTKKEISYWEEVTSSIRKMPCRGGWSLTSTASHRTAPAPTR
jgi:hypothetical protein